MPYEYTAGEKQNRRSLKQRIKSTLFIGFHLLAHLLKGFGAYRAAGGLLRWLVSMGDDKAMFKLGEMYWWGYKFIRDPVKAIELIEYASIRGNPDAIRFKQEMTDDGIWRQGKKRDEFMDMFDSHVNKERMQTRSMHIIPITVYTVLIVVLAYFLRNL